MIWQNLRRCFEFRLTKKWLWPGLILFCAFLVLLVLEMSQVFGTLDQALTEVLQTYLPRVLDLPLSVFSLLGSFEVISLILLLLVVAWWRRRHTFPWPLALFGLILAIELFGKFFLYHPGPPSIFFRYSIPFVFPTSYVHTNYSFPSGHMARTAYLLVLGVYFSGLFWSGRIRKNWAIIAAVILATLMAVSRVYLGEHWASDVLGGGLLGTSLAFLTVALL